jgi:hypothetical protein
MNSRIIEKLCEYGLVKDNMKNLYSNKYYDKFIEDYSFYRMGYCENFYTEHPNADSLCCDDDTMLTRKQMGIRLNIIKSIFNKEVDNNITIVEDKTPEWTILDNDFNGDTNIMKCVCSHNISNLNFILHNKTNIVLLTGSECVNNFEDCLLNQIKCSICNTLTNVRNMKIKPYSLKCCSNLCYNKKKFMNTLLKKLINYISVKQRKKQRKEKALKKREEKALKKQEEQKKNEEEEEKEKEKAHEQQRQRLRERQQKEKEKQKEKEIKLTNYRLPFGKYEGQILKDTNPSYIDWVYRNVKLKKYKNLKEAIEYNFDVIEEYEYY